MAVPQREERSVTTPTEAAQEAIRRMDELAIATGLHVQRTKASFQYSAGKSDPAVLIEGKTGRAFFDLKTLRRTGRDARAARVHKSLLLLSSEPVQLDVAAIPCKDLLEHWDEAISTAIGPFLGLTPAQLAAPSEPPEVLEVRSLIAAGESARVEFKSSARWDQRLDGRNKAMEDEVVKTVAGFANSKHSGTLLIGVAPDGSVLGLDHDFKLVRPQDADGFENWLTTLLTTRIGKTPAADVRISMVRVSRQHVCVVRVDPSSAPVFDRDGKETVRFFVRMNNSTRDMNVEDALDYARKRFEWGPAD